MMIKWMEGGVGGSSELHVTEISLFTKSPLPAFSV